MAERVEIWNNALGHIGQGVNITDPLDDTAEGRACRRFYPRAVNTIFAEHSWRFSRRTSALAAVVTPPPGCRYAYPVPGPGCLEVVRVTVLDEAPYFPLYWRLGGITSAAGDDETLILTDEPAGFVLWLRRIENEELYPPLFATALEYLLASMISSTFERERAKRNECLQLYDIWLTKAKVADQRQVYEDAREPDILTAQRSPDAIDVLTVTGGAGIISGRV